MSAKQLELREQTYPDLDGPPENRIIKQEVLQRSENIPLPKKQNVQPLTDDQFQQLRRDQQKLQQQHNSRQKERESTVTYADIHHGITDPLLQHRPTKIDQSNF